MRKTSIILLLVCFIATSFSAWGTLRVKRPNGGNGWAAGQQKPIKWYHSKNDTIKIELWKGTAKYLTIKDSLNTADSTYVWTIPSNLPVGSDYKVKIFNYNNVATTDASDNNFDIIYNPYVKVTAPIGGELLRNDRPFTITWLTNLTDSVNIQLLKGGTFSSNIAKVPASGKSYIWTVPSAMTAGNDYQVRISHLDSDSSATRDSSFDYVEIAPIPFAITSPTNTGIKWVKGSANNITWDATSTDSVKLELYRNNTFVSRIHGSRAGADETYAWTIPKSHASGDGYKIKITSKTTATNNDESNFSFSLYDSIYTSSLVSDKKSGNNNNKLVRRDSTFTITWLNTSNLPASDSIKIELFKGGTYNKVIARTLATPATYAWTVPSALVAGNDYSIKIMSIRDSLIFRDSTKVFTISDPAINLRRPNGGEYLQMGVQDSITFTTNASAGARYKIELLKGTTVAQVLVADTTYSGVGALQYLFKPRATLTEGYDYKIRISSLTNTKLTDISSAAFAIVKPPVINITAPNGGESLYRGGSYNIAWTQNFNDSVMIALIRNNAAAGDTIVTVKPSTSVGTYAWNIPNAQAVGYTYKFKIWRQSDSAIRDSSDANFKIIESPIRVTCPDAQDSTWLKGSTHTITWVSTGLPEDVKIELIKQGSTAAPIVITASAPNNNDGANGSLPDSYLAKYIWSIPASGIASGDYKVKISSIITASYQDLSNAKFTITDPDGISITTPDAAGLKLLKGSSYNITWTDNIHQKVKIDLLKAGAHHAIISDSTASNGSFTWNIPTSLADATDYKIRIRSVFADSAVVKDSSSNNFQLATAAIVVNKPNSTVYGMWTKDSTVTVNWTTTASGWTGGTITGKVKIEVLKNNVLVYTHATTPDAAAGPQSVSFKIPTTWAMGYDYKVRVTSIANATYTDMSDSNFTVQYAFKKKLDMADQIIKEFKLDQNFPNPFNNTTDIVYYVPTGYNDNVNLAIYNIKGQMVQRLVNSNHKTGKYVVSFNANNLVSGIYYYVIQGKDFKDTKRMLLLK